VFRRKRPQVQEADLIDLLLAADEPTRRLLMLQVLQSGTFTKSEAEQLMAQVVRLERVAGPRRPEPWPEPRSESQAA
jgi:hypothetical protein